MKRALWLLTACCWAVGPLQVTSAASLPSIETAALRPTFGGVLLEGRLQARGSKALTGVWADAGRGKLMRCAPSCSVVDEITLNSTTTFSQSSMYRVVLGGAFKTGQRVRLLLRFSGSDPVTISAVVSSPLASR